jgi:hypothetical protein
MATNVNMYNDFNIKIPRSRAILSRGIRTTELIFNYIQHEILNLPNEPKLQVS